MLPLTHTFNVTKILRGTLTELVKNIHNKLKKETATPTANENIVKPSFVPIKEKAKVTNNRIEAERNEFELKFKEVTCKPEKSPLLEMCELKTPIKEEDEGIQEEKVDDEKNNSESNGNGHSSSNNDSLEEEDKGLESPPSSENECNGNMKQVAPPKPLPRTSRTNSLAESNSMEEVALSPTQRPLPKPRTTAYKVPDITILCCYFKSIVCLP